MTFKIDSQSPFLAVHLPFMILAETALLYLSACH